jgi:hypothetical protein
VNWVAEIKREWTNSCRVLFWSLIEKVLYACVWAGLVLGCFFISERELFAGCVIKSQY